jgi:molybdopterin molybdotransferase
MLSVEEALERCLSVEIPVRTEPVPLRLAHGRVLAEPVVAHHPLPPWDNSAMDGYAVRSADTSLGATRARQPGCDDGGARPTDGVVLRVAQTIPAGSAPAGPVASGTCARIFTGAPMPPGADAVVMQENTAPAGDGQVQVLGAAQAGQHVRRAGEDLSVGDIALKPGQRLTPARVGLCAALGKDQVVVARRPRVAILATGDEIVRPGEPLGPGQIWSSNTATLMGMVAEAGGEPIDCGVAPDDLSGTREAFQRALDVAPDLLISTGGVSVGDFDVVRDAMVEVGAEMSFWKVAVKPGKPLAFGVIGGVPAFGLPGNPVSCAVGFLQFVRPVIRRAQGDPSPFLAVLEAVLVDPIRKRPGRAELVRVRLEHHGGRIEAHLSGPQGSGRPTSLARAHGLVLLGAQASSAEVGDRVPVQIFDPSFLSSADAGYRWGGRRP